MILFGPDGASGCGRGVMPFVRQRLPKFAEAVFIDEGDLPPRVNGHRCLTWADFLAEPAESRAVCLTVADSSVRLSLTERCHAMEVGFFSAWASRVLIMDDVQFGGGAILSPFVSLTSNTRIGLHFHANLYSYVEHDCVIGDFVAFAPGVKCNGYVVAQDFAYVGAGAVLRQGDPGAPLTIGHGAVVGMGAAVTKDPSPGVTVVGNPARPLTKT